METYKYYLNQRPAGPGAVPKGSFSLDPDDEGGRYGSITYLTPLSEKDIAAFELTPAFKKDELKLTNMNFDLLVDREFNEEEHHICPGPFCIIDGDGNEKNFDFTDMFIDPDKKNPFIVHVDLWNFDDNVSAYIDRNILQNAKFKKFNIYTGEEDEPEIKPRMVENLKFSFGNSQLESFSKLDLSLHKSLTYNKGSKTVSVAEEIEEMARDNIRGLAKAGDWNLKEETIQKILSGEKIHHDGSGVYLGYVGYGNSDIDLWADLYSDKPMVSICFEENILTQKVEQLEVPTFDFVKDGMSITSHKLYEKYICDTPNKTCTFTLPLEKLENLDELKFEIALKLQGQGIISFMNTKKYAGIKAAGLTATQQVRGRCEQLLNYSNMKADPANSFVGELCHKDKLTPGEIDRLANYFDKACDYIFVKGASPEDNNRLLVGEMKKEGLDNGRIQLIIGSNNYLKEQFTKSGVALALKQAETRSGSPRSGHKH